METAIWDIAKQLERIGFILADLTREVAWGTSAIVMWNEETERRLARAEGRSSDGSEDPERVG